MADQPYNRVSRMPRNFIQNSELDSIWLTMQDRGMDPLDRLIQVVEGLAANQIKLTESINRLMAQRNDTKVDAKVTAGPLAYVGNRPNIDRDQVVAWYGPNMAVTRKVMDMVFRERGAQVFTLEFPTLASTSTIKPGSYREKYKDTGYQVFLLLGFGEVRFLAEDMRLSEDVDNWINVIPGPEGILWSSLRSNNELSSGIIVDGPT